MGLRSLLPLVTLLPFVIILRPIVGRDVALLATLVAIDSRKETLRLALLGGTTAGCGDKRRLGGVVATTSIFREETSDDVAGLWDGGADGGDEGVS